MGALTEAFEESVRQSSLVDKVDAAIVESGRQLAKQIDYARENLTGQDLTKALYLMPHLVNVLRELMATPLVRKVNGVEEKLTVGKLAKLRALN